MIHFQAPINVKIRDGIRVNVTAAVSHAVERGLVQKKLKKEIGDAVRAGTLKRGLIDADYDDDGKCDTISFWFVGGTSLCYRVGFEITQEDFKRIVGDLEAMEFKRKDDGKPSDK